MSNGDHIFEKALYTIFKEVTDINYQITTKKMATIQSIKRNYVLLKNKIEQLVPASLTLVIDNQNINCHKELKTELERSYVISIQLFKSYYWGEFAKLNPKNYSDLYTMMIDKDGDLHRSYDNFNGTLAIMDFHGYTQFSKDIKYNKTPLQEFGNVLPQKIERICSICRSIVYEMEGDTLIIIGPEDITYIFDAVLCIIELCRQKPFNSAKNPKLFHGIDIKNPMIKPFELNASVTTSGSTFINNKGHIIGSIIAEANRMLKIINTKKPHKSGIMMSDKVFRKLEKFKNTNTECHTSIFDFKTSDSFLVDVKGTRLNIREAYLEEKDYIDDTTDFSKKLADEIKKKNPAKWHNILSYYMNLVLASMNDIKCTIQIGTETYTQDKIKKILEMKFYDWVSHPAPTTINDILKISSILYSSSEEIRDVTAVYHEFIHENYGFISKRLDDFYQSILRKEANASISTKKIINIYETELEKIKKRFPAKRIMETVLTNEQNINQLLDVPYMGKK